MTREQVIARQTLAEFQCYLSRCVELIAERAEEILQNNPDADGSVREEVETLMKDLRRLAKRQRRYWEKNDLRWDGLPQQDLEEAHNAYCEKFREMQRFWID